MRHEHARSAGIESQCSRERVVVCARMLKTGLLLKSRVGTICISIGVVWASSLAFAETSSAGPSAQTNAPVAPTVAVAQATPFTPESSPGLSAPARIHAEARRVLGSTKQTA